MPDVYLLHRFLRKLSSMGAQAFFNEVHVIGGEHVPKDGPLIVVATHHNMMLDPAILSTGFPHGRILHYWSKASLYANPIVKEILLSSGNIPVDRKSKDRRVLLKGTFDALAKDEVVALFPEGTSYTEPMIMQVKDGASWALLEYAKYVQENKGKKALRDPAIIPAAIVYTNKSKYRSNVILEFSPPIRPDPFMDQFLSGDADVARSAVKRLTKTIERILVETTVNAPDWDTLYSARMARDILWENERSINLDEFVVISQTLVDLFTTPNLVPNIQNIKLALLEYYSLLQSTHLTNSVLSNLPLPKNLDPRQQNIKMPSRLYTLAVLVKDTLACLIRLPFFAFPLLVHVPVYVMARLGAKMARDEEETQAQNKVAFAIVAMLLAYPTAFFFFWALFFYTPIAAVLSVGLVTLLAYYHATMIDDNYEQAKRLIAAWRVLVGVWAPAKWEFSLHALAQYATPIVPEANPWLDKYKNAPKPGEETSGSSGAKLKPPTPATKEQESDDPIPAVLPPSPEIVLPGEEEPLVSISKTGKKPNRRPPSRRIMRHVLRARVNAIRAVAQLFDELARQDRQLKAQESGKKRVYACEHLGRRFGGVVDLNPLTLSGAEEVKREGWRDAEEVVRFLKANGAKIPSVVAGLPVRTREEDWAALSSDGEGGDLTTDTEQDEAVWVPPGQ